MNDGSYIKLNRSILEWEWYLDINTCRLFLHMLLKANWKDGKFQGTTVPRGSFVSSLRKLSEETGLTERELRTAIKHLKTTGEMTSSSHSKYTVFTVVNYDIYQSGDTQNDRQETDRRQTVDSQETDRRQSNDKRTTTIEERKKERKEEGKKGRNKYFVPPSLEDVNAYCLERDNGVDPQGFIDFYASKGWMVGKNKMADWKAAVRTWERNTRTAAKEPECKAHADPLRSMLEGGYFDNE